LFLGWTLAHVYGPTVEVEIRRWWLEASLHKKFTRPLLNKLDVVVYVCGPATGEALGRWIAVQVGPGKNLTYKGGGGGQ
jgi:hypothetical protein